jgi:hypothetical protein
VRGSRTYFSCPSRIFQREGSANAKSITSRSRNGIRTSSECAMLTLFGDEEQAVGEATGELEREPPLKAVLRTRRASPDRARGAGRR